MSNTPFSKFKPVFILTLLLSSGLTACGDDSNSKTNQTSVQTNSKPTAKKTV